MTFFLHDRHGYSHDEIFSMIPWELEIYTAFIAEKLEREAEEARRRS